MSDRMSVSLNWERLRVVGVKKKAEELGRKPQTGRFRDEGAECLNAPHMNE